MFNGSFIPEWLMPRKEISPGGKLCYSRLARYAGKDGKCNPKIGTLAKALGVSDRQCSSYLSELKEYNLIKAERLGLGKANIYLFIQHKWMGIGVQDASDQDMKDTATLEVQDASDQDMKDTATPYNKDLRESVEESQFKESNGSIEPHVETEGSILANRLQEAICTWDETHKYNHNPPALTSWEKEIDKSMRLDGRTQEQLQWMIEYLFRTKRDKVNSFWAPNIQSGKKLRDKFDQIKNQIKSEQKIKAQKNGRTFEGAAHKIRETEAFLDGYYSESE